jgi:CRP-like cAMP-binding protein
MNPDLYRMTWAALLALLAMASLIVGVVIGLYVKPSRRINAIIMAFGTGALIQALSLELAYEGAERLVGDGNWSGLAAWACVSIGFVTGGCVYYAGNRWLDHYGAALRHPALTNLYFLRKKRERSADLLARLARAEILRSLPPGEMQHVLLCVEEVSLPAGSLVFHLGDPADAFFLVDAGRVEIRAEDGTVMASLGPGQAFGETALLGKGKRTATVMTVKDAILLKIPKVPFDELLEESPMLRQAVESLNARRLVENVTARRHARDAAEWQKLALENVSRLDSRERAVMMARHAAAGSPLALFLGAALDGIPESVVIGSTFETLGTFRFTFLVAIFLSNVPEAVGSTMGMRSAGYSAKRIYTLWGLLVLASTLAAVAGSVFLSSAPPLVLTLVGSVAGGGILAMVASVMMPEAYEDGGPSVGLATIAGFLSAFLFTFV